MKINIVETRFIEAMLGDPAYGFERPTVDWDAIELMERNLTGGGFLSTLAPSARPNAPGASGKD